MKQMLEQLMGAGRAGSTTGSDTRKAQMKGMGRGLAARELCHGAAAWQQKMRKMAARWRRWEARRLSGAGLQALSGLADPAVHPAQPTQPLDTLEGKALDARANLLVRAMVAAARADSHIDAAERQKIREYLTEQGGRMRPAGLTPSSPRPSTPMSWREVTDMELATEVYLALPAHH